MIDTVATMTLRKQEVQKLACASPDDRVLGTWIFTFPGCLFFIVIVWNANRSLIGSFKSFGIRPVFIYFGGEHNKDYRILAPL